jgi:predicted MFS family arabinose efflux permease
MFTNLATTQWPHRKALVLATLLIASGFGALAFTTSRIALAVASLTFGEMMLFPVAGTYVAELATPDRVGDYMGAYWIALSVARMWGPWGGTLVLDRFGSTVLWTLVFGCGVFTAIIFGFVVKSPEPPGVRR